MDPKQCKVCNNAQSKYKCPSCLIPYCSLGCFKKHKETPCAKPASTQENLRSNSVSQVQVGDPELPLQRPLTTDNSKLPEEKSLTIDDPNALLSKVQLESIASSSEIRNALKDESLQQLICSIDVAADPETELEKAKGVEAFHIFTDKILSALGR